MTLGFPFISELSYEEKSVKSEDTILSRRLWVYLGGNREYSPSLISIESVGFKQTAGR